MGIDPNSSTRVSVYKAGTMPTTFRVSDVEVSQARLETTTLGASIKTVSGADREPEAMGANTTTLVESPINGFVQAVHYAFDEHLPLTLSPDDVWLCIAQGFAYHVNANAEGLRKRFVAHEGRAIIRVIRDHFVKGSPSNDWQGSFAEFSEKIGEHIGKKRDLLVSDFSTTGPIEHAASNVVLMDSMKTYFDYRMRTRCGFPRITLLGTAADWQDIRQRAAVLSEFECSWWIDKLTPVLDEFVSAAQGNANKRFWESFYKEGGGSGGPYVTGAINALFPYLQDYRTQEYTVRSCYLDDWNKRLGRLGGGPTPESLPMGLVCTPFIWEYLGTNIPMELLGGFVGCSQDAEGGVRPAIGWAVREAVAS